MKDQSLSLNDQYLDASDGVSAALRRLQATHFIFHAYVDLICGEKMEQKERIEAIDLFLYALDNMKRHLAELEDSCEQMRVFHQHLMNCQKEEAKIV